MKYKINFSYDENRFGDIVIDNAALTSLEDIEDFALKQIAYYHPEATNVAIEVIEEVVE